MKATKQQIIPDVEQLARDLTGMSQVQIVLHKFIGLSLGSKIIFAWNNLRFIPRLINKDFATGIKVLCELEILDKPKRSYILHNQMVDMAIALKNKSIIEYFFYLSGKYRFKAALATNNPRFLIPYLSYFNKLPTIQIYASRRYLKDKRLLTFIKTSKLVFVAQEK